MREKLGIIWEEGRRREVFEGVRGKKEKKKKKRNIREFKFLS